MHNKLKGSIACSAVVLALQQNGFNVFSEIGDLSRVDLIAEKNNILRKIQVKFSGQTADVARLRLTKSGPCSYTYTYSNKDVDWFAVYSPGNNCIAWVSFQEIQQSKHVTIRLKHTKNHQQKGIKLVAEYSIDKFLRDFTQDTVPSHDEDKVQTTTSKDGSGN